MQRNIQTREKGTSVIRRQPQQQQQNEIERRQKKKKKTSAAQTKMDNITKLFLYRYTVVCRMVALCIVCISLYSFRIQLNLSAKYVSDVSVCVCLCSGILPSDSMRRYATYMHLYNKHEH